MYVPPGKVYSLLGRTSLPLVSAKRQGLTEERHPILLCEEALLLVWKEGRELFKG